MFLFLDTDVPCEVLLRVKQEEEATPLCGQFTVEKEQPSAQLYHLLPSSSETCTGYKVTPSATSLSKTQDSLKHPKVNVAPDGDGTDMKLLFLSFLPSQVPVLELLAKEAIDGLFHHVMSSM